MTISDHHARLCERAPCRYTFWPTLFSDTSDWNEFLKLTQFIVFLQLTLTVLVQFVSTVYHFRVATFKKMYSQEKVRQMKAFEKQEKQLKEMKAAGKSTKQAVSLLFIPDEIVFGIVSVYFNAFVINCARRCHQSLKV